MSTMPEKQGFDIEHARHHLEYVSEYSTTGRYLEAAIVEIERLRAELIRVNKLRETEIDQAGAAERIYLEAARLKDTRIQELEDALVEVKAEHNYGPQWKWTGAEKLKDDYRQSARKRLQAEGKIGPDAKPRSWQITDERKAALKRLYGLLVIRYKYSYPDETETLRAMLDEHQ